MILVILLLIGLLALFLSENIKFKEPNDEEKEWTKEQVPSAFEMTKISDNEYMFIIKEQKGFNSYILDYT